MKKYFWAIVVGIIVHSCTKPDEATKTNHYREISYRIDSQDSSLEVSFFRAIYDDNQKGNIKQDTFFPSPGIYNIPTTVLANERVELFGLSYRSNKFSLQIIGPGNVILAETDSIPLDPANQLHPDRWFARITAIPH